MYRADSAHSEVVFFPQSSLQQAGDISTLASSADIVEPRLQTLSRALIRPDSLFIDKIVGPIAAELQDEAGEDSIRLLPVPFSVSLLTPRITRQLYTRYYRLSEDIAGSVQELNGRIGEYRDKINQANPDIPAILGGISIFGAMGSEIGPRYVAVKLAGTGKKIFTAEYNGLMDFLLPVGDQQLRDQYAERNAPHLTLAKTYSQDVADQLVARLSVSPIRRKCVRLDEAKPKKFSIRYPGILLRS